MHIGILGAASIAKNRFLPALQKIESVKCVGIAARDNNDERLNEITEKYSIRTFNSYDELICSDEIDTVYIPLPPALHYRWAKKALENGKNVFLEKPSTDNLADTEKLVEIAKEKNLAIYENYMFQHHSQLNIIEDFIMDKRFGDLRLIRSTFSFPRRAQNDFRYSKELGGGALLDAGGYVIKLAKRLLGDTFMITESILNKTEKDNVDIYGSFTAVNDNRMVFQGSFGMDNNYQCSLELFFQKGKLTADRIFTSGADFSPKVILSSNSGVEEIEVEPDDHFMKSILYFEKLIENPELRNKEYKELIIQSKNINTIKELNNDLF